MIDPNEMSHELFWQQVGRCGRSDIDALMEAEQETRAERIQTAFERGQMHAEQAEAAIDQRLFTQMWLGQDLEQVNREWHENLTGDLQTIKAYKQDSSVKPRYGLYDLSRNARLLSLYFCFGPNGCVEANRLTPDNRRLLVELLWWRTMEKNDIAITRRSTWWLAGSENHDLNSKTTNLLASLIFANDRNYANKPLPNHGYGCAPGYHKAGFNPRAVDDPSRIGTGRADWSDGKTYTAADHYQAWVTFLTEYFAQRARRGFFLENGSPGYMRYTISYILLVYNFCPDTVLREQVRVFLDLFWADWALQQLGGLRGGPKTRHHGQAGQYDAMSDWARFYLGGPGLTGANYAQQLLGDYAWPALIWELVLDREGLGSFAYVARGVGEEEPTCPRPMGVERTMTGDCASRMVKYSWVTPDYVLGTQMDHPMAIHNHLSSGGRWQGLITSNVNARIATVSLAQFPGKTKPGNEYSVELMYHSAQDKNVLITQQKRRWMQINPDWFPAYESIYDVPFGLYIGTGWTTRTEKDGWLFLEQDDTFAAIRILRLKAADDPVAWAKGTDPYENSVEQEPTTYTWNADQTIVQLVNKFSPIIIEAGRRADYPTLADFQQQILSNRLEIHRTVVTRETRIIVVYHGTDARPIVFNAANQADIPTIGGEPIDYSHPRTFDAPYLQSDYESGIVELRKGEQRQLMDFNVTTITQPVHIEAT